MLILVIEVTGVVVVVVIVVEVAQYCGSGEVAVVTTIDEGHMTKSGLRQSIYRDD